MNKAADTLELEPFPGLLAMGYPLRTESEGCLGFPPLNGRLGPEHIHIESLSAGIHFNPKHFGHHSRQNYKSGDVRLIVKVRRGSTARGLLGASTRAAIDQVQEGQIGASARLPSALFRGLLPALTSCEHCT